MARPYTGSWQRRNAVPYRTTDVWGTGINPVHSQYGEGHPVRVTGRNEDEHSAPWEGLPDDFTQRERWGYTTDDCDYTGHYINYDARPPVGVDTPEFRGNAGSMPPMDASGGAKTLFRAALQGARRLNAERPNAHPSETVTEGWRNKPKGDPADSEPADHSQVFVTTSEVQRYKSRNNQHAQMRGTDEARADIPSRVVGQKLKVYSGGDRHYDMFPYQQDDIPRAFYYRTAGTGDPAAMDVNDMYVSEPIQRRPPDDPDIGESETEIPGGYTTEDHFYA